VRVGYAPSARGVRAECAWGTRWVRVEHRYILKDIDRSFPAHAAFASLAPPSLIPSLWRVRPSLPTVCFEPTPPPVLSLPAVPSQPLTRLSALPVPLPLPLPPVARSGRMRSLAGLWGAGRPLLPVSCGRRRVY
jgi:hypothetical protein